MTLSRILVWSWAKIKVKRYFTNTGEPTCIRSMPEGMICEFFRVCRMGTGETCLFAPESAEFLQRRSLRGKPGLGFTIPGKYCRVFTAREIAKCTNS
jgi:hypothetical protein